MKNKLHYYLNWHNLLHPFWQRMPVWLQRQLIWMGSSKFLVGVAMICINSKGNILLVKHRFHNDVPWGLPGGWVDRGEAPVEAGLREVREETGLEPFNPQLIDVTGDGKWTNVIYACDVRDGEPVVQASELTGYRWFDPTQINVRLRWDQVQAIHLFVAKMKAQTGGK